MEITKVAMHPSDGNEPGFRPGSQNGADSPSPSPSPFPRTGPSARDEDEEPSGRQLALRIGAAGLAIVLLLVGLSLIDKRNETTIAERNKLTTMLPPPMTVTETPAESATEVATESAVAPQPAEADTDSEKPAPASRSDAAKKPEPAASLRLPSMGLAGVMQVPAVTKPAPVVQQPTVVETRRNGKPEFVVQAGVFNNFENAEKLRVRLQQAGIPAQIETRVKIGPFANKAEAEAARQKMIALGLEPGIVSRAK